MRKNHFIHVSYNWIWFILLFTCVILSSCKKNDALDTKDLLAYAAPGNSGYNVISGGSIALIRNTILSGSNTAFPVLLTRSFEKDVEVTAKIDTGLLRAYDSLYQVTSPALPAGAFLLANNGKVTIKAGQSQSGDSLQIRLTDASKIKTGTNTYVVPVALSSASNGISVSATRQVMYVQVNVTSIATGLVSLSGTSSVNILLNNINGVNIGTDRVYLRALLNQAISKSVTANAEVNTGLISAYNSKNNTSYQVFPTGSYQLVKTGVTIPANSVLSADSVQVKLPDLSLFTAGTDYLLPVSLKDDASPDNPPVDITKNVVYVVLSIFVNNVDPANPVVAGTVMDRTGWVVTSSGGDDDYLPASLVLDGDNSTAWDGQGQLPEALQLDMGAAKTVKGFAIVPSYEYTTDDFINMGIYSSNDGTVWKLEGNYVGTSTSGSSSASNPDIKNVKFVTPVTARYFKFNITATSPGSGNYCGMAELNGVE